MKRNFPLVSYLTLALSIVFLAGCESTGYYSHIAYGHLSLLAKRQPVDQVLKDATLTLPEKEKLASTKAYLAFAAKELQLPTKGQYTHFVHLNREYPIWSLIATPPYSIEPLKWCYPIVGCMNYRGFYDIEKAKKKAKTLEGQDVYIAPATAYSTLGWFSDPILSSFLRMSDSQLAGILFHELAHQKLYVENDTTFNESFATAIEIEGVRRWSLAEYNPKIYEQYLEEKMVRQAFVLLVSETREKLRKTYADTTLSIKDKQQQKEQHINALKNSYQLLKKEKWAGKGYYDNWFKGPLNNAQLSTIATYYDLVDPLLLLLKQEKYDLHTFYETCEKLGKKSVQERHDFLNHLSPSPQSLH